MFTDIVAYSGLHAKIKALESRLLTYEDYYTLASQRDVPAFASKLFENPSFKEYNAEMQNAISGGRIPLEKSLVQSMYLNFSGIFSFLTDLKAKRYLNIIFLKYEAEIIKGLLRTLFDERDIKNAAPKYNAFFAKRLDVDIERLEDSKNIKEFLNNMGDSKFFSVLNKINTDNPSLFDFETQLDLHCYLETWEYQHKYLKRINRKSQERINGSEIDLRNIMHIYRFKKYYDLPDSIIYTCLVPINYKIKKSEMDSLINASTDEDFREILEKTYYKSIFSDCPMNEIEKSYYNYMLKIQNEEEKKNPYSISIVTAYFFKKGQEIRNLITLTECVRYGIKPDISMKKLNIALRKGSEING